ncbi:MAG TPA: hypothetical protein VFU72_07055 [Nitrolancea sp.]|nr:hypothetical protein [Nitrolancea sp.]
MLQEQYEEVLPVFLIVGEFGVVFALWQRPDELPSHAVLATWALDRNPDRAASPDFPKPG